MIVIDTANHIAALAAKMAKPAVIAAYPITPQTTIVERLAQYVEKGELKAEFIRVESEHSAMAACIGAAATGVRTFTATSSHGLLLMHEMLHWAGLARLPIVMVNVNRALGPGWNIWSDLNDSLAQRDTGWLQFYASSNQEVFDNIIQAYKIAENSDVMLPAMIAYDGFILSHTSMPVEVPSQQEIDAFLPPFKPSWTLDIENPITHGNIVPPEPYMEIRYSMHQAMENAKKIIEEVGEEFGRKFGREYGLVEEYRCEDADYVIVTMAALAAEARVAVDELRSKGEKAGLLKLRTFRPFPHEYLKYDKMIVIDRDISPGLGGIVYNEIKAGGKEVYGFIAGLGGVDVSYKDIERIYELAKEGKEGWYPTEVK
ncbi:MAG TPA: pyruvate ferredoxin oxidoreductase [Thermoplasmatales archaeon]|nr:pyruvate ferredoxin oxidoreductase [Thermoplasmatales archaeon]